MDINAIEVGDTETIALTKLQARKFLLFYHGLYGDYEFSGTDGVMAYIRRVGCIQFDPLNVVGMNPELVLQSRIGGFDRSMLPQLLYEERRLVDYWDKNMSIFPTEDWMYFRRFRERYQAWCNAHPETVERVYEEIRERGRLCSGDLQYDEKVNWAWGPTRLSRAALEAMYHAGLLVVHHKTNTRKYYDLAERHIPKEWYEAADPFETDEQYYDWYVLRRIGSVGLLWNRPSDAWLGVSGLKSARRHETFARLLEAGRIIEVAVEGMQHPLFMRRTDQEVLNRSLSLDSAVERASVLAPLDNLLWDRVLVQQLFDFEYRWEVYKPEAERKYGYYVLPVLYGDRIVARFDPAKQRSNMPLSIQKWWWEDSATVTSRMKESVVEGLERLAAFLGTTVKRGDLRLLEV